MQAAGHDTTGPRTHSARGRFAAIAGLAAAVVVGSIGSTGPAMATPESGLRAGTASSATPSLEGSVSTMRSDPRGDIRPVRRINWQPCRDEPAMQCGSYLVPRNWRNPAGDYFRLAVRRLPATGRPGAVIGSLFVNPGGPGGSGTEFLGSFTDFAALRGRFHIVSWDPRGVPTTTPNLTNCPDAPTSSDQRPATGAFGWTGVARNKMTPSAAANQACLRLNQSLTPYLGTNDVVQDLDALRSAVGDRQLNYLGYSYGTTIGRTYALRYPNRVRVLMLDGVTAPTGSVFSYLTNQGVGGAVAWPMIKGSLTPATRVAYDKVANYLQTNLIIQQGASVNRWDLWSVAINAGRDSSALAALPSIVCGLAAAAGIPAPGCGPTSQSRGAVRRALDEVRAVTLGSPILQMVNCSDQSGRPTPFQVGTALTQASLKSGPEAASNVLNFSVMCSGMPPAWNQIPALTTLRLSVPPLLINGIGDTATPMVGARANARGFLGSRLVSVRTTFHGLFGLVGSKCVNAVGLQYLINRKLPAANLSCPAP